MWEQIKALGLNPGIAIAIGAAITIAIYLAKAYFERLNKVYERNQDILHEQRKQIIGLANTINKLIIDYDHFVKHLADGDSEYIGKVNKWHNEIREEARKISYLIKNDHPDLLDKIYDYTDYGKGISPNRLEPSSNNYFEFNRKHVVIGKLLDEIRAKHMPG